MGKEIASVYATLGVKDDQFKKGLTNAKSLMSQLNNSKLGQVTQQLTGFSLTSLGAAGAVAGIIKQVAKAVNQTVEYNSTIKDMARLWGVSTEEASRLVQATDDLFIEQDTLKAAMQAATRQGIDVSTEGLKRLSDQYLALNPNVERGEFLMKTFGRSGADMGKLMEVGANGIDKAMAAVEGSLVVTDKSIEASDEYKRNLDKLSDSWMGLKIAVGNGVIPVLNAFLSTEEDVNKIELANIRTQERAVEAAIGRNIMVDENKKKLELLKLSEQQVVDAIEADSKATEANTLAREESKDATNDAESAMKGYTAQLLFNLAAEGLNADEALKLAYKMGLVDDATVFATQKQQEWKRMLDTGKISVDQYTVLIAGMKSRIDELQSKDVVINVDTYYNEHGNSGGGSGGSGGGGSGGNTGNVTPFASGGSFIVPAWAGYEGFNMGGMATASAGERVTVTPQGQSQSGGITATQMEAMFGRMITAITTAISQRFA